MSVIYTSGGAASIADATTTTSGKVRLATIAEAGGSSELIAVTPAGLQAEIAGIVSGITYRGTIDVADFGTTLANATQGDYYKISTGGTSGGVTYDADDAIIVNADMGGTFDDAKLDRIDNVDSELIDDTTPQLGGDLDVNGHSITSGVGDIVIDPGGAGEITIGADVIPDADVTHSLGSEDERYLTAWSNLNGAVQFKAQNASGGPINKGDAVYIIGVSGSVPTVGLARADSASTMPAFGLAAHNANSGAEVQVVTFGNLEAYNTTTYSLSRGDTLYVSETTAGALTNSAPAGEANLIQNIGRVVRADASAGILKVGGAGRSNATPNLDDGKIFLGDASNQSVSTAISTIDVGRFNDDGTYLTSAPVDSVNGATGVITLSADDLSADHTATNYTATNSNIDGHLSGIDTALASVAVSAASETTAGIIEIATNAEATAATATDRAIVPSNLSSINLSTLNNDAGYIASAPVDSVNGATGVITLSADDLSADHTATNYTATNSNIDGHLSGIDTALASVTSSAPDVTTASPGAAYDITTHAGIEEIYLLTPSASVVVNIPAASASGTGFKYNIKNLSGSYSLTLTPASGTIDGESTHVIDVQFESITIVSDGTNYHII